MHHVNGKGENKGVVYCEMQVRTSKKAALCISLIFYPFETKTFAHSSITSIFIFREEKIVKEVLSTALL